MRKNAVRKRLKKLNKTIDEFDKKLRALQNTPPERVPERVVVALVKGSTELLLEVQEWIDIRSEMESLKDFESAVNVSDAIGRILETAVQVNVYQALWKRRNLIEPENDLEN